MRITMLLCDHAVVAEGKLYINGGGWSVRPAAPMPMFLALKFDVPWDRAGRPIHIELHLVDEDGHPVLRRPPAEGAGTDTTPRPVVVAARLEVGRPTGLTPGAPVDAAVAIGIPPFPLPPARRYSWRLLVDGEQREDWVVGFATRAE